jgi:hypothetical protein
MPHAKPKCSVRAKAGMIGSTWTTRCRACRWRCRPRGSACGAGACHAPEASPREGVPEACRSGAGRGAVVVGKWLHGGRQRRRRVARLEPSSIAPWAPAAGPGRTSASWATGRGSMRMWRPGGLRPTDGGADARRCKFQAQAGSSSSACSRSLGRASNRRLDTFGDPRLNGQRDDQP